jgi:hypothetical protein
MVPLVFYGKLSMIYLKILINWIGIGGILSLSLTPLGFFNLIWWPLGVILEKFFQNQWWGGIVGLLIINNNWLFIAYVLLLMGLMVDFAQSFGKVFVGNKQPLAIKKNNILSLLSRLGLKVQKRSFNHNNFYENFSVNINKTVYPMVYLVYDLQLIGNFLVIIKSINQNYLITITHYNNNNYNKQYLKSKKLLYMITHWKFLFHWLMGANFVYLGLDETNQLLYFPLKKIYNFFIIDKQKTLNVDYNNKNIFHHILSKNIVYILHNTPENPAIQYKNLVNYLENCLMQSKINKKPIVLFLYHQLSIFDINHHKPLMDHIKFLIKNTIGYYNIVVVEHNSQIILDIFGNNIIDANSALLTNGVDSMVHSKLLLGSCGYEQSSNLIFKTYKNTHHCLLPLNNIQND